MSKQKFVWDENALIPESIPVTFPALAKDGTPDPEGEKVEVTFYELPHLELLKFVTESEKLSVIKPAEGETVESYRPIEEVGVEHSDFLNTWLSKSCRKAKTPKWFADQQFGVTAVTNLCRLIMDLNHVVEIMASRGNLFMLPLMAEDQTPEEAVALEPLQQTPQA